MITIIINNVYCQINNLSDMNIIDKLDHKLSYYVSGYNFTLAYKQHRWDGKKHLLNKQLKFQTGLLSLVENFLQKENIEYQITDTRSEILLGKEIQLNSNYYTPRDYQHDVVNICLKEKCGLVKVATGGGKTLILSMLLAKLNIKSIVYVISIDLLYQTKEVIEKALNLECGIIGNGECIIKKITIAMPQTIIHAYGQAYEPFDDEEGIEKENINDSDKIKIQKVVEEAQCFIFDEAQFLAASSFQLIAKSSKNAAYRLGFSGTPHRDDGANLALMAATGNQLIDISATSLIERNILVPPKIFFFKVPELDGLEKSARHSYSKVYELYIVENITRNNMILESAVKLYMKKRKILILVKRKKHGLKLLDMMPKNIRSHMLNGDSSIEERQLVKNMINSDELDVIIASSIFDQGVDILRLDSLILAGGGRSTTRSLQRIGRVIRGFPGKKDAIVVDFIDTAQYVCDHSKKRYETYKQERAFQIKLPNGFAW